MLWLLFQVQEIKNAMQDLLEMRTEKKGLKGPMTLNFCPRHL